MSGLIALPANIIIVSIFRYAKERPPKLPKENKRLEKLKRIAHAQKLEKNRPVDVENELMQQKEYLETGDLSMRNLATPQPGSSLGTSSVPPENPYGGKVHLLYLVQ